MPELGEADMKNRPLHMRVGFALAGIGECWRTESSFRSHVVMQRHGFGQGEYQSFAYPLPERIEALRQALYPELAAVRVPDAHAHVRDLRRLEHDHLVAADSGAPVGEGAGARAIHRDGGLPAVDNDEIVAESVHLVEALRH